MEDRNWKYKIGVGLKNIILPFIPLALFGGITAWSYINYKPVFFLGVMLTILGFVVVLLTIYGAIFKRVLIAQRGFYYQTNPGNGRYYYYSSIKEAWTSSGRGIDRTVNHFCNLKTSDGEVIKFPFYEPDSAGIMYLIKRVKDETVESYVENSDNNQNEYIIDGKRNGKAAIVVLLVLILIEVVIASFAIRYNSEAMIFFSGLTIFLLLYELTKSSNEYFYLKVQIGSTGFYFRSNPFNGKYYKYSDIKSCEEIFRAYRNHPPGSSSTELCIYYFVFKDNAGKTMNFSFDKSIYEHEINVLKKHIEAANNQNN